MLDDTKQYEFLAEFTLEEILPYIGFAETEGKPRKNTILLSTGEGETVCVNLHSLRLRTFQRYGIRCVKCGVEGTKFRLQKFKTQPHVKPHLGLWGGVDQNGNETMITKDHIIPKAKGGKDTLDNMQPMCRRCNAEKGSS